MGNNGPNWAKIGQVWPCTGRQQCHNSIQCHNPWGQLCPVVTWCAPPPRGHSGPRCCEPSGITVAQSAVSLGSQGGMGAAAIRKRLAATARREAVPDRVRRLTNSCLATTGPSVANPVRPDGLPEEPSDKAPTTASVVRAHHRARFCEPTTHFVILKNK